MPSSPAPTGTGLSNYLITYVDGDLTVNRAALTITANDNTKTYGGTLNFSGNEFSDSGLLNSDSITSVTLTERWGSANRDRYSLALRYHPQRSDWCRVGQLYHHLRRRHPDRHTRPAHDHCRQPDQSLRSGDPTLTASYTDSSTVIPRPA